MEWSEVRQGRAKGREVRYDKGEGMVGYIEGEGIKGEGRDGRVKGGWRG